MKAREGRIKWWLLTSRITGMRGIWASEGFDSGGRKLGSVGLSVKHDVASHGFALNIGTDLSFFDHIVACGLKSATATSICAELKRKGTEAKLQS